VKRLKIRVVTGESPIFWVKGNGALEVRNGFGVLVALRVGYGQHVQSVIVVGVFVANQTQVCNRLIVLTAVYREGGGVQSFRHRLRRIFSLRCLPLTDVQVEAYPLVKLLLIRILPEHCLECVDRCAIVVTLKSFKPALVKGDRLEVGRSTLRGIGSCALGWLNVLRSERS
jgi:hypothetical protein